MITLLTKLTPKVRRAERLCGERKAAAQDLTAFPEMTRRLQTALAPLPTPATPRGIRHTRTRCKRRDAPREVFTQPGSPAPLPASGCSSWMGPGVPRTTAKDDNDRHLSAQLGGEEASPRAGMRPKKL